ncbi:long-chain fatty acid transport protein [Pseudomonas sp. IT-196MI5]
MNHQHLSALSPSQRSAPCLKRHLETRSTLILKSSRALFITTMSLALCGQATLSLANGLSINEQSVSSAGTAYAGRSSAALDASTVYGNPAGLSKIKRREVSGGFALFKVNSDIKNAHGDASGTHKGDSVPLTTIPFGYLSIPIDERFTFGLGMYALYGLVNDYESSFQGRYHGSYSKVQVKTLNSAVAYRINDHVSVGGGLTLNRIENNMQTYLATGQLNGGTDTKITIKGNDNAVGYNFGLMVDLNDSTTWGVTYHSKLDFHVNGHTQVSNSPSAFGLDGKYSNKIDITLPESLDTSFTHHFNERWTGYLGATWTRWSRVQRIEAVNSGVPPLGQQLGFNSFGDDFKLHDTWSMAVGASYQLSPQWLLRSGFAYDPSPARNADRNVRLPVGDRKAVTLGIGFSPDTDLTIDLAYGYLWESTTSVSQANTTGVQPGYSAKYDNSAHIIGTQITYRF